MQRAECRCIETAVCGVGATRGRLRLESEWLSAGVSPGVSRGEGRVHAGGMVCARLVSPGIPYPVRLCVIVGRCVSGCTVAGVTPMTNEAGLSIAEGLS